MPSAIFETRFFIYFFASPDPDTHRKLLRLMGRYRSRLVSAITLYEVYKLSLEKEGKETCGDKDRKNKKGIWSSPRE